MVPRTPRIRHRWALLLGILALLGRAQGADFQDIPRLEALARSAAQHELPALTEHERLVVGPVQLDACDGFIHPSVAPGLRVAGRILIELRCESRTHWHLYVPVRVTGTVSVAVAAHTLVTGTVLTAQDLRTEQHDRSELQPGYLDDPTIAVGLTASRGIAGGAILTDQLLLGRKAVQRGQSVTLLARIDGMSVRMAGRAMSDGLINQRIKVENLSSGKIVEGIARSEQIVEIIFQ
jgi:flagella basal body P-ring formation protein FlgA